MGARAIKFGVYGACVLAFAGAVRATAQPSEDAQAPDGGNPLEAEVAALVAQVRNLEERVTVAELQSQGASETLQSAQQAVALRQDDILQRMQNRQVRVELLDSAEANLERAYQTLFSGNLDSVALSSADVSLSQAVRTADAEGSPREADLLNQARRALAIVQPAVQTRNVSEAQVALGLAARNIQEARSAARGVTPTP